MDFISAEDFKKIQFDKSNNQSIEIGKKVLDIIIRNNINIYSDQLKEALKELLVEIPNEIQQATDIFKKILWPTIPIIIDPEQGKLDETKHPFIMICSESNVDREHPNVTEYYGFRMTSHPPKITGTELDVLFYSQLTSQEVDYTNTTRVKESSYLHCDNICKIILDNPYINGVCNCNGEIKKRISIKIKDFPYKRLLTDLITKHTFLQEHHMALPDINTDIILLELEIDRTNLIDSALYSRLEEITMRYPKQVKKVQDKVKVIIENKRNHPDQEVIITTL